MTYTNTPESAAKNAARVDVRDRWSWVEKGPNTPERLDAWKAMIRAGYDPVSYGRFYLTDPAKREAYIALWGDDNADPSSWAALFPNDCEACHGDGVVTVPAYRGGRRDPENDRDEMCDECYGAGCV